MFDLSFSTIVLLLVFVLSFLYLLQLQFQKKRRTAKTKEGKIITEPKTTSFFTLLYLFLTSKSITAFINNIQKRGLIKTWVPLSGNFFLVFGEEGKRLLLLDSRVLFDEGVDEVVGSFRPPRIKSKVGHIAKAVSRERHPIFIESFKESLDEFTNELGESGVIEDLLDTFNELVLKMVFNSTCGKELLNPDDYKTFAKAFRESGVELFFADPTLSYKEYFWPSLKKKRLEKFEVMHKIIERVVRKREASGLVEDDFLNYLIKVEEKDAEGRVDSYQVFCTIWILIVGAQANTFATAAWSLYHANTPTLKAKVLEEIESSLKDEVTGKYSWTVENLKKMKFVERIVLETLRVYVGGIFMRLADDDIDFNGELIPKGELIFCPVKQFFSDERVWGENATKFDPFRKKYDEELDGKSSKKKKSLDMIQFGAGKHPCTGKELAYILIKILISVLMTKYDLQFEKDLDIFDYQLLGISRPKRPMKVVYTSKK